ncbi:hypothetical protein [Saccharibacillus brassicae]|uniref:DUF4304 domain-containing protein n=1 Tax=Saccharibacillus brassicae TaxID=2583377 RepID=A0A4Y6UYF1_SACBS|nr:hypothetical protein [Saccharibacillus brassicae]QDH21620.1 hypothetical protein FFV09_12660 [Saccharibacillus brassicae]
MKKLSDYLKTTINPFLHSKGFKLQKKDAPTIWTYVRIHKYKDQIIQISQSNYDKNSVRFYAYINGFNEEDIGSHFLYYKDEEELEEILQSFIFKFESEVFPYLDQKSNEIFYEPSLDLAKKLLHSYKSIAKKFINQYNLNLNNRKETITFLQNYLYVNKQKNEVPINNDMESVCVTLMSLIENSYDFQLDLDEYSKSPFMKDIGGNEEAFLLPLNLVYVYWNKMNGNEGLLKEVIDDIEQRVNQYEE